MFAAIHVDVLTMLLPALTAGAAALYLLLPRPRPYPSWAGALLGALAILLFGGTILRTGAVTAETFLFYAFSLIAIVSGVLLVTQHHPARAALAFTLVILSTCGLFLLLAAPFLAAATIIIYAGAIIVTFLFVLMLAQQAGLGDADARSREPLLASITGFVLLGALVYVLQLSYEKNETIRTIDETLAQTRAAKTQVGSLNKDEIRDLLDKIREPVSKRITRAEEDRQPILSDLSLIRGNIINTVDAANLENNDEHHQLKDALDKLDLELLAMRQQYGWVRPHSDKLTPLSNLSGPKANEVPDDLRYDDKTGRLQMPADNSAYLGRSLFTDYLLPVELGGFLLLIATIGSIAIAQRRTTPERIP